MASENTPSPPLAFSNAFERLRDQVTEDEARLFTSTTMKDVWDTAEQIERFLDNRRSLRGLKRIEPFLVGLEQYSKIVEVLCNGTPYLPWIWAPIKLLLQIAQGHISAMEKLIDAYAMIAEAMPRFDRLSAAFIDNRDFQQVMGLFYADILEFHRRSYKYFRQRAWKILFDSFWKSFNLRLQAILERLRKHRDLVDQEATATDIVESKAWRTRQLEDMRQWRIERDDEIDKTERDLSNRHIREAAAWLDASEEQEDLLMTICSACEGSHWTITHPQVVSWLGEGRDPQVLWLNGNPGAGKSVICAKIIMHMQQKRTQDCKAAVALFFFCQHDYTFQNPVTEVLRTLAIQLLAAKTELAAYILETWANKGLGPSKKVLQDIIGQVMDSLGSTRICVDGLDEWPQNEQIDVLKYLLSIKGSPSGRCKIMISSRRLPAITKYLSSKPTLCLEEYMEDMQTTISAFVSPRLRLLASKVNKFNANLMEELERKILTKANGMFLWVKLVMHTLEESHFERNIREAIDTLPDGLEAVYERIMLRICGDKKTFNQRIAVRILQWLLVTKRPLKREELEVGIVLDEQLPRMTSSAKPLGDVLSLCYPIINVEDTHSRNVSFFHFTVVEYLKGHLWHTQAQPTVALSCVLSLTSGLDLVDPQVEEREKISSVLLGLHDLHIYANDYFIDHLLASAKSQDGPGSVLSALRDRTNQLVDLHNRLNILSGHPVQDEESEPTGENPVQWDSIELYESSKRLLIQLSDFRTVQSMQKISGSKNSPYLQQNEDPTLFSATRAKYQTIVEDLLEKDDPSDEALADFKTTHRSGNFLCRFRHCPQGFDSSHRRQEHETTHKPRFKCSDPSCGLTGWIFESRAQERRHASQYHKEKNIAQIPSTFHIRDQDHQQVQAPDAPNQPMMTERQEQRMPAAFAASRPMQTPIQNPPQPQSNWNQVPNPGQPNSGQRSAQNPSNMLQRATPNGQQHSTPGINIPQRGAMPFAMQQYIARLETDEEKKNFIMTLRKRQMLQQQQSGNNNSIAP